MERRGRVIINADDLGESGRVNREISLFAASALISSVSLIANGADFEGGKRVVSQYPKLSVGAHLNLTQFKSLSKSEVFIEKGVTDEEYLFTGSAKYSSDLKPEFDNQLVSAVFAEWDLQITKLLDNGVKISHIDSHNNVHYHFALLPVIKRLQAKYKIERVRPKDVKPLSFYGLFNRSLPRKTPPLKRELMNFIWNRRLICSKPKARVVDHVFSYLSLWNYLSTGSRCPKRGTFEIIVHPGSDYLDYFSKENELVAERALYPLLGDFELITCYDL